VLEQVKAQQAAYPARVRFLVGSRMPPGALGRIG
jgi:hypothetical protein